MVGSGYPACILAIQTCLAYKDVLYGIVEHVTHVQHSRHIWWGNDNGIGLTSVGFAAEQFVVQPVLVPLSFYIVGSIFCC